MHGAFGNAWGYAWGFAWGRRRRSLEGGETYVKRCYYVRKNGKIHLFNTPDDADAFSNALHKAELDARTKTSRLARKRVREAAISNFKPEVIDLQLTTLLSEKFNIPNLLEFVRLEDWDKVLAIQAMAIEMEEEEDTSLFLALP
jgi:hypothetical protein